MGDGQLTRRALLKGGGALIVTFAFLPKKLLAQTAGLAHKSVSPDAVGGYIAIDAQGMVTLYSGKVELGTGAVTAITQMAAEELAVPMDRITTIQGDTQLTPDQGPTFSSLSIQNGGMQVRHAAATARAVLLEKASQALAVSKEQLVARDGIITPMSGGKGLTYAQLVGDKPFTTKLDPDAPLMDPKHYSIVGTSVARLDIPGKIFGTFNYVQDVKVPDMVHARMVHPAGLESSLTHGTTPPARQFPATCKLLRKAIFWRWWPPVNGLQYKHRRPLRLPGLRGKACQINPNCSNTCVPPTWYKPMCSRLLVIAQRRSKTAERC